MEKIKGWNFKPNWDDDKSTNDVIFWKIFKAPNNRTSIIYGKNGSGKTTFAQAVSFYKQPSEENFLFSYPIDENGSPLNIDKDRIFVFDEKFTQEKIGFKTEADSLNAIVMFGDNKNLDKEINELVEKKKKDAEEIMALDIQKYERDNSNFCLSKLRDDIKNVLKKHWAIRDRDIKGNQKATTLPGTIFEKIEHVKKPQGAYNKQLSDYNELLERYKSVKAFNENLSLIPFAGIRDMPTQLYKINELLNLEVQKPITSELANKILLEIKKENSGTLFSKTQEIIESDAKYCPCCFQELTSQYKLDLKKAFNSVIDKEVQELRRKLIESKIQEASFDFNTYLNKINDVEVIKECVNSQNLFNSKVLEINKLIDAKYNNPYAISKIHNIDDTLQIIKAFEKSIEGINHLIQEFNDAVKNTKAIKNSLDTKNLELSFLETNKFLERYHKLEEKKRSDDQIVAEKNQEINDIETKINLLKSKLKNTDVALKSINADLKIIFGSDKAIQLYPDSNGNYRITSHNRKVKLINVSVGERNAISICYFFSLLKQNEKEGKEFTHPLFLVIDDPISSFDRDNKFGVLTILKYNIKKIIQNNDESKVIILTHDLMTAEYLSKLLSCIKYGKHDNASQKLKLSCYVINSKKELEPNDKPVSQYKSWLQDVFEYAKETNGQSNGFSRQNEMRRILETYFTFNYGKDYESLQNEGKLLNKIKDINIRKYFEISILKLGLNCGSHSDMAIKYDDDGPYGYNLDCCTQEEKHQLARDLLCLLYSLDDLHVISLLSKSNSESEYDSIVSAFDKWLQQIKEQVK